MPRIQPLICLLRPLAAPRTATCRQHLRFSTAARLCAEKQALPAAPKTPQEAARAADLAAAEAMTESDSAQPPEPKPDLPSQRATGPATTTPPQDRKHSNEPIANAVPTASNTSTTPKPESALESTPIKLQYHVQRSVNRNLPIYTDRKRGGNLHQTVIRKITGDSRALRNEIRVYLKMKEDDIKVNPLTQHVIIKGYRSGKVKEFLEEKGF